MLTTVIIPLLGSMVATDGLFDEYTIGALLLLVGLIVIGKGVVSVSRCPEWTVNVDAEIVFACNTEAMTEPAINQIRLSPYVMTETVSFELASLITPSLT